MFLCVSSFGPLCAVQYVNYALPDRQVRLSENHRRVTWNKIQYFYRVFETVVCLSTGGWRNTRIEKYRVIIIIIIIIIITLFILHFN